MKRWKNDEPERLRTVPSLLWLQTRIRLQGLLEMALHGAVGLVMLVSHSRHSGRGRGRLEVRTRAEVPSACFPKILSRKKRKKKTLSAAARRLPRQVRMLRTMTLIAVRYLWFAAKWKDLHSSCHPFRLLPRGLQSSRWMLPLLVSLRRHRQQSGPSIYPQSLHLRQRTNAPSRSPFPMYPRPRRRSADSHSGIAKLQLESPLPGPRRRSGDLHRSLGFLLPTWTSRYKSRPRVLLLKTHLRFRLSAPSRLQTLLHPHQLCRSIPPHQHHPKFHGLRAESRSNLLLLASPSHQQRLFQYL